MQSKWSASLQSFLDAELPEPRSSRRSTNAGDASGAVDDDDLSGWILNGDAFESLDESMLAASRDAAAAAATTSQAGRRLARPSHNSTNMRTVRIADLQLPPDSDDGDDAVVGSARRDRHAHHKPDQGKRKKAAVAGGGGGAATAMSTKSSAPALVSPMKLRRGATVASPSAQQFQKLLSSPISTRRVDWASSKYDALFPGTLGLARSGTTPTSKPKKKRKGRGEQRMRWGALSQDRFRCAGVVVCAVT